jgi:site-specific DNA-cytosine methylase
LNVGVLCEFSGIVRDAFIEQGHNAISFDLLPTEQPGPHHQGDLLKFNEDYWKAFDLLICHPPCTHLAVSGARWFKYKQKEQNEALGFVWFLMQLPVEHICIENPVSIISSKIRKPDQYIQPWQFGHGETKKTGLWLKNLPLLEPTNIVGGRENKVHKCSPGKDRWKNRSRTYKGIAKAMAEQWSKHIKKEGD